MIPQFLSYQWNKLKKNNSVISAPSTTPTTNKPPVVVIKKINPVPLEVWALTMQEEPAVMKNVTYQKSYPQLWKRVATAYLTQWKKENWFAVRNDSNGTCMKNKMCKYILQRNKMYY